MVANNYCPVAGAVSSGKADLVPRMLARLGLLSTPPLFRPKRLPKLKVTPPFWLPWNAPNWPGNLPPPRPWLKSPSPKLFCPPKLACLHSCLGGVVQAS